MKRVNLWLKSTLLLGVLILSVAVGPAALSPGSLAAGGNRCTDHCADGYKIKKDACKLIPFKTERKVCERRAKEAKNDCKHRCR